MKILSSLVLPFVLCFAGNCKEEPDCIHYQDRQTLEIAFAIIDDNTGENLIPDHNLSFPKRIEPDSVCLFNASLQRFPKNSKQMRLYNHGALGYMILISLFDQSKVPDVDILTPGTVTYYLYSGNSDFDTIVFDYHFQARKYCYSPSNDTLITFINGKAATFSDNAPFTNVFAICR